MLFIYFLAAIKNGEGLVSRVHGESVSSEESDSPSTERLTSQRGPKAASKSTRNRYKLVLLEEVIWS